MRPTSVAAARGAGGANQPSQSAHSGRQQRRRVVEPGQPEARANPGGQLLLRFGPWLLIGLLPMFFGLGLVLMYVLTHDEQPPAGEKKAEGEPAPPA